MSRLSTETRSLLCYDKFLEFDVVSEVVVWCTVVIIGCTCMIVIHLQHLLLTINAFIKIVSHISRSKFVFLLPYNPQTVKIGHQLSFEHHLLARAPVTIL